MTFKKWILHFKCVDLPIGDLAREDISKDPNFPETNDYIILIKYLESCNIGDVQLDVFNRAWKFYKIEFPHI